MLYAFGVRGGDYVPNSKFVLLIRGFVLPRQMPSLAQRVTWIPVG